MSHLIPPNADNLFQEYYHVFKASKVVFNKEID